MKNDVIFPQKYIYMSWIANTIIQIHYKEKILLIWYCHWISLLLCQNWCVSQVGMPYNMSEFDVILFVHVGSHVINHWCFYKFYQKRRKRQRKIISRKGFLTIFTSGIFQKFFIRIIQWCRKLRKNWSSAFKWKILHLIELDKRIKEVIENYQWRNGKLMESWVIGKIKLDLLSWNYDLRI